MSRVRRSSRQPFPGRVFTLCLSVALGLVAALVFAPPAFAAKSLKFRHGLVPGTSYDLVSRMEMRVEADMGGFDVEPVPEKPKPGATNQPGDADQLGATNQLGAANPPAATDQPATPNQPGAENSPAAANQPGTGGTPSGDAETVPPPESSVMELRQDLTMRSTLKVGAMGTDGALPLDCSIDDLQGVVTLAGQEFPVPGLPDEVRNAAGFRGRLLAGNREVQVETAGLDELPPDTRQMLSQILQNLPTFPEGKLKIGDSFESPVSFELPGLPTGGDLDTHGSVTYTLKSIADTEALFDTKAVLSAQASEGADGAANTVIAGRLEGTAVFDRVEGIFKSQRATLTMELKMDVEVPREGGADAAAALTTTQVKAKAVGPVEIRMTRKAAATP